MSDVVADIDEEVRLNEAVRRLVASAPVDRIILFGSKARGDDTADSDFDICVILDDDIAAGRFTPVSLWREVSDLGLSIQIMPLRNSVFEAAKHDSRSISHEIQRDGRVLYERRRASP